MPNTPSTLMQTIADINSNIRKLFVSASKTPRLVAIVTSTAAGGGVTTGELKDGGTGDLSFYVSDPDAWYRVAYHSRINVSVAATTCDIRIRDGGASSPSNTSTPLAGYSICVNTAGGVGATGVICENYVQLAVGQHTIAAFLVRTGGTGTITQDSSNFDQRILTVEKK